MENMDLNNYQHTTSGKKEALPRGYKPTALDVCSGRGKTSWLHEGNVAFRKIIRDNVHLYQNKRSKFEKSCVIATILDDLRAKGFKFLKKDKDSLWYDIGDAGAREKVAHGLRDQIRLSRRKRETSLPKLSSKPIVPTEIANQRNSVLAGFPFDTFEKRLSSVFSNIISQEQPLRDFRRLSTIAALQELDDIISKEEQTVASRRRSFQIVDNILGSQMPAVPLQPVLPLEVSNNEALQATRRRSSTLQYLKALDDLAQNRSLEGASSIDGMSRLSFISAADEPVAV